ncbi:MAG: dodecin family protein [Xanthomonadales bacterium]|nr:dodecin family protein [Xanthomonadales bacterium]
MSFAKTIEMTAESREGFRDAIRKGIDKATSTLDEVRSVWVEDQMVTIKDGSTDQFRVRLKVTFQLK